MTHTLCKFACVCLLIACAAETGFAQLRKSAEPRFPRLRKTLTRMQEKDIRPQDALPPIQQPLDALHNMPVIVSTEAHAGRPYGIGKVTFRLREGDEIISRTGATWFTEENGRIFYPVIAHAPIRKFIQILSGNSTKKTSDLLTLSLIHI